LKIETFLKYYRDGDVLAFSYSSSRRGGGAAGSFGYDRGKFSVAMDIYDESQCFHLFSMILDVIVQNKLFQYCLFLSEDQTPTLMSVYHTMKHGEIITAK